MEYVQLLKKTTMNVKMIYDVYEKKIWRKDATDERDEDMKKRLMRNRVDKTSNRRHKTIPNKQNFKAKIRGSAGARTEID